MGKTLFDAGNKALGIKGTKLTAAFMNLLQSHRHDGIDADGSCPSNYAAAAGTANAITLALVPAITAHVVGLPIVFKASLSNTGATTININGLGAVAIKDISGAALLSGNIAAGAMILITYTGAEYRMLNPVNNRFSLGTNASYLPDGRFLQWGVTGSIAVGGSQAVTFPIAFPSAVSVIMPYIASQGNSLAHVCGYSSPTTSGFNAINTTSSAGPAIIGWIALGY